MILRTALKFYKYLNVADDNRAIPIPYVIMEWDGTGETEHTMTADFNPVPVFIAGLIGAAVIVGVIYFLAVRWKRRSGVPYCLSACLFYGLLYLATFQYSILNLDIAGRKFPADSVWIVVLGQSAITAFGVTLFTLILFGGFIAVRSRPDRPVNQVKAFAGCALFCLALGALFNPIDAAKKRERAPVVAAAALATGNARVAARAKRQADQTVAGLLKRGIVQRIENGKYNVTHYVGARFRKFPDAAIESYAKAALADHLYFNGGRSKPVVFRDGKSGRRIAVRYPNGRFKRD